MNIEEKKICKRCKIEKSLSEFSKDKRVIGGFRGKCKSCVNEEAKRRYHESYKSSKSEYAKKNKDRITKRSCKYYTKKEQEYFENPSQEVSRICTKCGEEKDISMFGKDRRGKNGISNHCRVCINAKQERLYYKNNEDRPKRPSKLSDAELSRRNAQRAKRWRNSNQEEVNEKQRERYRTDLVYREKILAANEADAARRKAGIPPTVKSKQSDTERKNSYQRQKRKNDIQYKLGQILRVRLREAIRAKVKASKAIEYLGCTISELEAHLESQFHPNPRTSSERMTWINHTKEGWHIDHIKPLASFDLTDPEQLKEACHYTNLQPLWSQANLEKGSKAI